MQRVLRGDGRGAALGCVRKTLGSGAGKRRRGRRDGRRGPLDQSTEGGGKGTPHAGWAARGGRAGVDDLVGLVEDDLQRTFGD